MPRPTPLPPERPGTHLGPAPQLTSLLQLAAPPQRCCRSRHRGLPWLSRCSQEASACTRSALPSAAPPRAAGLRERQQSRAPCSRQVTVPRELLSHGALQEAQRSHLHACTPLLPAARTASLYRLTPVYIRKPRRLQSQVTTPSSCDTEHRMEPRAQHQEQPGDKASTKQPGCKQAHAWPQAGPKLQLALVRESRLLSNFL